MASPPRAGGASTAGIWHLYRSRNISTPERLLPVQYRPGGGAALLTPAAPALRDVYSSFASTPAATRRPGVGLDAARNRELMRGRLGPSGAWNSLEASRRQQQSKAYRPADLSAPLPPTTPTLRRLAAPSHASQPRPATMMGCSPLLPAAMSPGTPLGWGGAQAASEPALRRLDLSEEEDEMWPREVRVEGVGMGAGTRERRSVYHLVPLRDGEASTRRRSKGGMDWSSGGMLMGPYGRPARHSTPNGTPGQPPIMEWAEELFAR